MKTKLIYSEKEISDMVIKHLKSTGILEPNTDVSVSFNHRVIADKNTGLVTACSASLILEMEDEVSV